MRPKEIIVPILNDEYKVIVAVGDDKFCRSIAKKHGYKTGWMKFDKRKYRGNTFMAIDCMPLICLYTKPDKPMMIGTLAHEAVHAVNDIWDIIDEKPATETFAHSVGAIVRTVMKEYL